MNKIKVARYRTSPYVVNFRTDTGYKKYPWSGSRNGKADIREIPEEVVERLLIESSCFRAGELVIIEDNETAKEFVETMPDLDEYRANALSKDDVIKILNSAQKKFETELEKIEDRDTKTYVIEVAKEIDLDSDKKLTFLAKWYGVSKDILFEE